MEPQEICEPFSLQCFISKKLFAAGRDLENLVMREPDCTSGYRSIFDTILGSYESGVTVCDNFMKGSEPLPGQGKAQRVLESADFVAADGPIPCPTSSIFVNFQIWESRFKLNLGILELSLS
jgi:hypothetical protein